MFCRNRKKMTPSKTKYDYDLDKINAYLRKKSKIADRHLSIREVGEEMGIPHPNINNWLERQVKNGRLEKLDPPLQYRRVKKK